MEIPIFLCPSLIKGELIKRYRYFLSDMQTEWKEKEVRALYLLWDPSPRLQ